MYLEGVIVCVDYADFLSHTLPQNKQHFNKLVVVTSTKDEETKRVCIYHHVQCIETDDIYDENGIISKGKAINIGLSHLSKKEWVVQLDADIYLPPLTRMIIDRLPLDRQSIYSMDRQMCPDYRSWVEFINSPKLIHNAYIYVHNHFPIGVRIAEYIEDGYIPIGYFQMWHCKETGIYEYPANHTGMSRTDTQHGKKFHRSKRGLIPELYCIHLESESLNEKEMGANWKGRKTKRFGMEAWIKPLPEGIIIIEDIEKEGHSIHHKHCHGYHHHCFKRILLYIKKKLLELLD